MHLLLLFIMGLGTGLSGAIIPGPLFLFTVSQSLKKGHAVGISIAMGHIIIETAFVLLIFFGFRNFIDSAHFMRSVSMVGGAALAVMGGILLWQARRLSLSVKADLEFDYGAFIGGAFFSIISPGFLIWWTTIGFSVVLKSLVFGLLGLGAAALGHWLADVGWHWGVSYFIHNGKRLLRDELYRRVVRALAFGLIGIGVYFAVGTAL